MYRYKKNITIIIFLLIAACVTPVLAQEQTEDAEQGLDEIQPLLDIVNVDEKEGMSLEEMTDVFAESAMSEYMDSVTGFSMQYPSVFLFDENQPGSFAATQDGKATMNIDNMNIEGGLDEETLKKSILFETPDVHILKNEHNGCLRTDRLSEDEKTGQTDLYLLTKHSLHHIVIRYPADEQEVFFSYIDYMINTMETKETDLG